MAEPCAPLAPCNDLDGKLLMQRSVYGPPLAFDPGTVPLAGLSTRGAALRGVLDLRFEVRWRSTGLCQGPATSVMGLAPGEVVTVGLRTRSTRTFSSLIRDAAESSRSSSHSDRDTGPAQKPVGAGAGIGGIIGGIVSAISEQAGASPAGRFVEHLADKVGDQVGREANKVADFAAARAEQAIDLVPIFVSKFGSIFGDALGAIGGAVGTVVGGVAGAVAGVGTAAGNAISDLVATGPEDARRAVRLDQGLAWERTDARGSAVHVPLADPDVVHRAWSLSAKAAERLQDALGRLTPDRLGRLFPQPNVRVVHVFAGVHVEAVPGNCVLPDIPDRLRVIVPGATQYHPPAAGC